MINRVKETVASLFSSAMGVFALLIICATIVAGFNEDFAKNGLKDVYIMIVTGLAGLTEPHSLLGQKGKQNNTRNNNRIDKQ